MEREEEDGVTGTCGGWEGKMKDDGGFGRRMVVGNWVWEAGWEKTDRETTRRGETERHRQKKGHYQTHTKVVLRKTNTACGTNKNTQGAGKHASPNLRPPHALAAARWAAGGRGGGAGRGEGARRECGGASAGGLSTRAESERCGGVQRCC